MFNFSGEFEGGLVRQLLDKDQANQFAKGAYETLLSADGTPRLPYALHPPGEIEGARLRLTVDGRKITGTCTLSEVELVAAPDGKIELSGKITDAKIQGGALVFIGKGEIPYVIEGDSPWVNFTSNGAMHKRTVKMKGRRAYTKRKLKPEQAQASQMN